MPRQLPIELWEMVIDYIADRESYEQRPGPNWPGTRQSDLRACCRTCRAWVSRSRFHLSERIVLYSREHLETFMRHIYSHSGSSYGPGLNRIRVLRIDGDDAQDQSWVSVVPFTLFSKNQRINSLTLQNVDLSSLNPRFHMAFSLFRFNSPSSPPLNPQSHMTFSLFRLNIPGHLCLRRLACTNWSQLSRLISASNTQTVTISDVIHSELLPSKVDRLEVEKRFVSPFGRFSAYSQSLLYLEFDLSLPMLCSLSRTLSLSTPSLQTLEASWHNPSDAHSHAMIAEIIRGFSRVFGQLQRPGGPLQFIRIGSRERTGPIQTCSVGLIPRQVRERGIERTLDMAVDIDTGEHATECLASMLSSFMLAQVDVIKLGIIIWGTTDSTSLDTMQKWWKRIDKVLTHASFVNVTSVTVSLNFVPNHEVPEPQFLRQGECINDLVRILLPRFTARNILVPCDGHCYFHSIIQ